MRITAMLLALLAGAASAAPNILLIYADDLGYGDLSCYGATKIQTPGIDRLAKEGLRFTDGHSSAATCTPSRYALLTGEYAFRKRGTGVLPGDAALVIEPGRATVPSMLAKAGYSTAVVGKWHLGLGDANLDWNGPIKPGPAEIGFAYSYIMAATGDRVPCVYVENGRVVGLDPNDPIKVSYKEPFANEPTGKKNPDMLKVKPSHGHDMALVNGISRIGYMTGGKAALWKDEDMADVFTAKAVAFLENIARTPDKPFFLSFNLHDIHVPRVPHPRFAGKSKLGTRGDVILQADWCVGEVLGALDRLKLAGNTLVILSSDNGPVVDDGYQDEAVKKLGDHKPAGSLRGGKYSNYEAGTRVPFIVRWPGRVKPGTSDALVCQVDFLASFAALVDQKLAPNDGLDSLNVLRALLGESSKGREHLLEQAGAISLRHGTWKYIPPRQGPKVNQNTNTEMGNDPEGMLFDLASDPGETKNVIKEQAAKAAEMKALHEKLRSEPTRPRE